MALFSGHYISLKALENRLSSAVVRRIYDDNNLGGVGQDDGPIVQLIKDAEAKFEGYCRGIYPLDALRTAKPNEAVRMCLDAACAMAAQRFPRAAASLGPWVDLLKAVDAEMTGLRTGKTRLDVVGSPEPASNEGGYVSSGDVTDPTNIPDLTFNGPGSWGSF